MSTSTDQSTDQPGESTAGTAVLPGSSQGSEHNHGEHDVILGVDHVHTTDCPSGGCGHKDGSDEETSAH